MSKEFEYKNTYIDHAVIRLMPQFEALAPYKLTERKKGKGQGFNRIIGWEQLAVEEAKLLKSLYPDAKPDAEKTYATATTQISRLKASLKKAVKTEVADPALKSPVKTIITHFGDALSYLFREYKANSNKIDRAKSTELTASENRLTLDLTSHLNKANTVLEAVAKGANTRQIEWRDVSCALALASGRRMSEIHLSGEFVAIGEHEVVFKGQLKGKGRKVDGDALINAEFPIPTLVKAELVCKGVEWLEKNGKRLEKEADTVRVNARWSKVLSERVKDEWLLFPDMTYHKFRGAYFAACITNAESEGSVKSVDYEKYAFKVLGDNDSDTVGRYKRFDIAEGSFTRI